MSDLSDHRKVDVIFAHLIKVEENMVRVAKSILAERQNFALQILQRARMHDVSKFDPIEFTYLWPGPAFQQGLRNHHSSNSHHPEHHFQGVHDMSELDLAEMACDWAARAQEFGTDARTWAFGEAANRYGFTREDRIGQTIEKYLSLALSEPFKR